VISGANVPLLIKKSFGPIMEDVDHKVSLILTLYLIVVWRVFAYFMEKKVQMTDEAIFHDTSEIIKKAILKAYALNNSKTNISATAFEIALKQLV
jgi:hypothetical protein